MNGWPKLTPAERIIVAQITGSAERKFGPNADGHELEEIGQLLNRVGAARRQPVLDMALQAYVGPDEDPIRKAVAALFAAIGADRRQAAKYREIRLRSQGFDLAKMADS